MHTFIYMAPTCSSTLILPSSGSLNQNYFETYIHKRSHNKHTYVVVSTVQNFTSLG